MAAVLFSADVVCPMTGPPLAAGGVLVVDGVVAAVGAAAALRRDAAREHHVDGVLLPGLVNGHTHLELTDAAALARPGPVHAWSAAVAGLTGGWSDERWSRSAHRGVLAALRGGATTVGDVTTRGPAVPAASRAGLRGHSFVEVRGVDATTVDSVAAQVAAALGLPAEGRRVGVGLDAPHTLGAGVVQRVAALAADQGAALSVHAAQSQAEVAALCSGAGPLAEAARAAGHAFEWLDQRAPTPVRYLDALGALGPATHLVHGVTVDEGEARLLARRGVTVVLCPRADAVLGCGQAPLQRYADAGVALALGTESLAVAPDLDVLAEAAAWSRMALDQGIAVWATRDGLVDVAEAAVRLATTDGARALGGGDLAGRLEPGVRADLVGVELTTTVDSVYRDLVEQGPGRVVLTVLGGVRKARREGAGAGWPPLDDDSWRAAPAAARA